MRSRRVLIPAGLLLFAGCGGDNGSPKGTAGDTWLAQAIEEPEFVQACEETPGCAEALEPGAGPFETIWRVQVVRDGDGAIRIGEVDSVEVLKGDGIPLGKASGDYLLVGVDEVGDMVDGQVIQFPRTMRLEFEARSPIEVALADQRVDTIGYLRADRAIRTIEIRDGSQVVVASSSTQDVVATRRPPDISLMGLASPAHALLAPAGLPVQCSHVRVLEGEVDREHAGPLLFGALEGLAAGGAIDEVRLAQPSGPHLAQVVAALGRMTSLLCSGIARIGFAHFPEMASYAAGAVLFAGEGETILINTASYTNAALAGPLTGAVERERLSMQTTITHEAGHAVEALLNSLSNYNFIYDGDWGEAARSKAEDTLDNARLHWGFGNEWRRIHDSFVKHGFAKDYAFEGLIGDNPIFNAAQEAGVPEALTGPQNLRLPPDQVVEGGFMTSYGSNVWWDDIAEFISEVYLAPEWRRKGQPSEDLACKAMGEWKDPNIPAELSAVYTKLMFLQDLGLVREKEVKECTGSQIGLQKMAPGFHRLGVDDKVEQSYTRNVRATIHTEAVRRNKVFRLVAEGHGEVGGKQHDVQLTLNIDLGGIGMDFENISWPRGVYKLSRFSDNNFEVRVEGASAANFVATEGFVLVTQASSTTITGSIVMTAARRPNTFMQLPQTFDSPRVTRFKVKSSR